MCGMSFGPPARPRSTRAIPSVVKRSVGAPLAAGLLLRPALCLGSAAPTASATSLGAGKAAAAAGSSASTPRPGIGQQQRRRWRAPQPTRSPPPRAPAARARAPACPVVVQPGVGLGAGVAGASSPAPRSAPSVRVREGWQAGRQAGSRRPHLRRPGGRGGRAANPASACFGAPKICFGTFYSLSVQCNDNESSTLNPKIWSAPC